MTYVIRPKSKRTRFVALDPKDPETIIAEGTTVKSVMRKARKTGKDFSMMFIPRGDRDYILNNIPKEN